MEAVKIIPRLKERYRKEVIPALMAEFGYANPMQVPRPQMIGINVGLGEALQNPKALDSTTRDIEAITGQHPVITRAKRSVAGFRLRTGMPIGVKVTLRGDRLWEFLDRLISTALPRIRDFHGASPNAFDGHGNYSIGIKEQLVFPEIEYDRIERVRGLQITIVTSAKTDEEGRRLLALLGMPFARE